MPVHPSMRPYARTRTGDEIAFALGFESCTRTYAKIFSVCWQLLQNFFMFKKIMISFILTQTKRLYEKTGKSSRVVHFISWMEEKRAGNLWQVILVNLLTCYFLCKKSCCLKTPIIAQFKGMTISASKAIGLEQFCSKWSEMRVNCWTYGVRYAF